MSYVMRWRVESPQHHLRVDAYLESPNYREQYCFRPPSQILETMDPTHALYVLLDSNLPTGGFVASGGLESYAKHGFVARQSSTPYADVGNNVQLPDFSREKESFGGKGTSQPRSAAPLGSQAGPAIMRFSNCEMDNFEGTTGYYLVHAWRAVRDLRGGDAGVGDIKPNTSKSVEDTIARLISLDHAHEATLLSHVSRRASKAQGVALLTLYARGMVPPPGFEGMTGKFYCCPADQV